MIDDPFEPARRALEAGEPELALAALESCDGPQPARFALAALAQLELESPREAEALLSRVEPSSEDRDWLWARGEVDLAHWRLDEARACYTRLAEVGGDDASLALRRSLIHDLEGDQAAADRERARAEELDPDGPPIPRLDEDGFAELVEQAIDRLPPAVLARLDQVAVVVEPVPRRELAGSAAWETPPDALGLFVGTSDLDRHGELSGEPGPVIYLFQRNLERVVADEAELAEQVEVTLLHELGHLFGFDEDGVDGLGLA